MTTNQDSIRPLPPWASLIMFGVPTVLMWMATRWGIPSLRSHLAGPDVLCWFVAGGAVFLCLFVAALVAFWIEQGCFTLDGIAGRFSFRRVNGSDACHPPASAGSGDLLPKRV